MLTYRAGAAGVPSAAEGMAKHLLEQTLPPEQARLAIYYQRGVQPAEADAGKSGYDVTTAEPRRDMDPRLAELLGLNPNRAPSVKEIACLLAGQRADGGAIPGKQVQRESHSLADELCLNPSKAPTPEEIVRVLAGCRADDGTALPEERAAILRRKFLKLYAVTDGAEPSPEALAEISRGRRADGEPVRLGPLLEGLGATRARVGYIDLCWSADKSVSLAWAFAPTDAERNIIAQAHKDAVIAALRYVEAEIGRARKGKAGKGGHDPGLIGWIAFDHYASRPTVEVVDTDPVTGESYTKLATLKMAGDPQLHTHVAIPNVVVTDEGRVSGLNLQRLDGRVHEFGAYYQACLATNLRRHGIDVDLDRATGAARITAIPEQICATFSKRTLDGVGAARAYAQQVGLNWDELDAARQVGLVKQGVQGNPRQAKQDDIGDWESWRRQAAELGWSHQSLVNPARARGFSARSRADRLEHAYQVAVELLDPKLQRRAVIDGAEARVAAARALVAAGIDGPEDIDAVMEAFATRGVQQDGQTTHLIWGRVTDAYGQERLKLTTRLQADREAELVRLAREAAADRSGALTPAALASAVQRMRVRTGVDFDATEHGRTQRRVAEQLGQGGRLAVAIGVAGSGKSTLLAPLVDAWHAQGRSVFGAALAWRQTGDLAGAGIPEARRAALSPFLDRVHDGRFALDQNSVVVVDELGLLGTAQLLDLLQLQKAHGFRLVAVGDPKQCQSIDAGPVVELLRQAIGPDAVPEILTTIRQQTERERANASLIRQGRAADALAAKRGDGTARLLPGDYAQVAAGIAALWQERRSANAHDPAYSLSVSAPTNRDARAISAAIREHRRASGELGPDLVVLSACDQTGNPYELPVGLGDRVRLFDRINATGAGRGILGNNGSVLEVRALTADGVTLRNGAGREGTVSWETLRDREKGRIRLTYGDVLTIDATQGLTSTEHVESMPAGTKGVTAFKSYTAASRHRRATYVVISEAAERREIAGRRMLGDLRPIREADVWANIGRNLSRQPEQESALAFLERAHQVRRQATVEMQAGLQLIEQRRVDKQSPTTLVPRVRQRQEVKRIGIAAKQLLVWVADQSAALDGLSRLIPAIAASTKRAVEDIPPKQMPVSNRIQQSPDVFAESKPTKRRTKRTLRTVTVRSNEGPER